MSLASLYSTQTVKVRSRTGVNSHGEPTYSTAVDVHGHVRYRVRLVRVPTGEELTSNAAVILPSTVAVGDGLLVSVDGGIRYHDVLELRRVVDCFGVLQHYEAAI